MCRLVDTGRTVIRDGEAACCELTAGISLILSQLTGLPPFYDENTNEMYRKILSDPLRFPDEVGSEARSLLVALLNRDPAKRLGVNGAQEIKNHPFFARHIDWKKLWQKKILPPFKPAVVSSTVDTFTQY